MSFRDKVGNHIAYNWTSSVGKSMDLAGKGAEKVGLGGGPAIATVIAGGFVGAFLGAAKVFSPGSIYETSVLSDEELEKRENDLFGKP
jgi:hypothetical protein